MPTTPDRPSDPARQTGRELARAEHVATVLATYRGDRLTYAGVWTACAAVVVGLYLPWSHDDGVSLDGFGRAPLIVAFGLVTVGAVLTAVSACRALRQRSTVLTARLVAWLGAAVSIIATIRVAGGDQDSDPVGEGHTSALGPVIFSLALAALVLLTHRATRERSYLRGVEIVQVREKFASASEISTRIADHLRGLAAPRAAVGTVAGAAGLLVAAAALSLPWQRLTGPAVTALTDTGGTVWTAFDLSSTLVLRWTLLAAGALVVFALALDSLTDRAAAARRVVVPVVLVAAGGVAIVTGLDGIAFDTVRGINSSIDRGVGPLITLLGGALCVAGGAWGLVGQVRGGNVVVGVVVITLAASGLTLAPVRPARAAEAAPTAHEVLGGEDGIAYSDGHNGSSPRLGGFAVDVDVADSRANYRVDDDVVRPDAVSTTGGLFFTATVDDDERDDRLLLQVVDGRALPLTLVSGPSYDSTRLIDVVGDRAIFLVRDDKRFAVYSVDLHVGEHRLSLFSRITSSAQDETAVLLTNPGFDSGTADDAGAPGRVEAEAITVARTVDGGMLIGDDLAPANSYLVPAAEARSGKPWQPRRIPKATVGGPGGVNYLVRSDSIDSVAADGATRPVVGGVSDRRCTLSRDPLSTSLSGVVGPYRNTGADAVSVDSAGDLFLLASASGKAHGNAYVRTADGVLRQLPGRFGSDVRGVQVMPDGSLLVQTWTADGERGVQGPTYRFASAVAVARTAPALGPVPAGCVSDNRVRVLSEHRTVRTVHLPAPPIPDDVEMADSIVLDTVGTRLVTTGVDEDSPDTVRRYPVNGKPQVVRKTASGSSVYGLYADGRGGAWWYEFVGTADSAGARLVHMSAAGAARVVLEVKRPKGSKAQLDTAADAGDGSLWWRYAGRWNRVTATGATYRLAYTGPAPVLRDGSGYAVGEYAILSAVRGDRATGTRVLGSSDGDTLAIPSALATKAPPSRVLVYGSDVGVAPNGDVLLYQDRYLARVTRAGAITVLTGADDGLPVETDLLGYSTVLGDTFVVYDGANTMWTVHL